jgi:hypothetical protein
MFTIGTLTLFLLLIECLDNPRRGSYWTHIIYLTEGKAFEIGNFDRTGILNADFDYPEPSEDR